MHLQTCSSGYLFTLQTPSIIGCDQQYIAGATFLYKGETRRMCFNTNTRRASSLPVVRFPEFLYSTKLSQHYSANSHATAENESQGDVLSQYEKGKKGGKDRLKV